MRVLLSLLVSWPICLSAAPTMLRIGPTDNTYNAEKYGKWVVGSISGFEESGHILGSQFYDLAFRCMDFINNPIQFQIFLSIDLAGEDPPDGWGVNSRISVGYRFDHGIRTIKTWKGSHITEDSYLVAFSNDFDEFIHFLDNLTKNDVLVYMIEGKTNRLYPSYYFRQALRDFKSRCAEMDLSKEDRFAILGSMGLIELVESWMDQF